MLTQRGKLALIEPDRYGGHARDFFDVELPPAYICRMTVPEILAIGLPTLSVLVGILLNRNDVNRLDGRITSLESRMLGEIGKLRDDIRVIRDDQREFYRTLGEHEVRLDNIERK